MAAASWFSGILFCWPLLLLLRSPQVVGVSEPGLVSRGEAAPNATTSVVCDELVRSRGYPCEEHVVVTPKGFALAIHRIPGGREAHQQAQKEQADGAERQRPPVFIMHGILQGSDSWLLNFPASNTLALTLADAGYDVFLGNFRGSRWSSHVSIPRTNKLYWDWSWDDLAVEDLPAMLEYIRSLTDSKVFYIGHSQGTLTLLGALAERPGLSRLLAKVVLMCPIAFLGHITSQFLRVFSDIYLDTVVRDSGLHEFNINSKVVERVAGQACAAEGIHCNSILAAVTGPNCCITLDRLAFFFRYEFQSTSVKNLAHLAQMVRRGRFTKYDYGWIGNLRHYLSFSAPDYNLQTIPANLSILVAYGGQDALSDPVDVQSLCYRLPIVPQELFIPRYAHGDFILGTTAKEEVYQKVVRFFAEESLGTRTK